MCHILRACPPIHPIVPPSLPSLSLSPFQEDIIHYHMHIHLSLESWSAIKLTAPQQAQHYTNTIEQKQNMNVWHKVHIDIHVSHHSTYPNLKTDVTPRNNYIYFFHCWPYMVTFLSKR